MKVRAGSSESSLVGEIGGFDNLRSPFEPEFVVGAGDIGRGSSGAAIAITLVEQALLIFRRFLFRKEFFSGELSGPLQRRKGGCGPDSLKIRLAIWSFWRSPGFGGLRKHRQWH